MALHTDKQIKYFLVLSQNVNPHTRDRIVKPECVIDYDVTIRPVAKSDAMISSIDRAQKKLNWFRKLLIHLLGLTLLKAHTLYKDKSKKKCALQDFIVEENAAEHPAGGRI